MAPHMGMPCRDLPVAGMRRASQLASPHPAPVPLQEARRVAYFMFHNIRASRKRNWIQQSGGCAIRRQATSLSTGAAVVPPSAAAVTTTFSCHS